jgi:hypothetical protein
LNINVPNEVMMRLVSIFFVCLGWRSKMLTIW